MPGDALHPHQYDLQEYEAFLKSEHLNVFSSILIKKLCLLQLSGKNIHEKNKMCEIKNKNKISIIKFLLFSYKLYQNVKIH